MEWIKFDLKNLPEGEVLCANFKKGTYGYREKNIGYVSNEADLINCEGAEMLEDCTHYIDINSFDIVED